MRKSLIAFSFCLAALAGSAAAQEAQGAYLGQALPGETAITFAPGIVSVYGRFEYGLAVSPDGKEIFFTAEAPGDGLYVLRNVDGKWTNPTLADLRKMKAWEYEAFYSRDGKTLFFTSKDWDKARDQFFFSEKTETGWSVAKRLVSKINDEGVMWCTLSSNGTIYYGIQDSWQLAKAKPIDGAYPQTEKLGISGMHPSVAADESFLLFNSSSPSGYGKDDILVVFRKKDGSWTQPFNLGNKINTAYNETCPSLSPDDRFIFFSRYNEPGGKCDIYWADIGATIMELRKTAFQ